MFLPFIVFVVVVGLIVGAYFAITALPGMMASRELDKRLRDVSLPPTTQRSRRSRFSGR